MSEETTRSHRRRLAQVLEYLDRTGLEDSAEGMPGLEELAGIACLSPHHFHRVFKAFAGMPVKAYVRRHKLLLAAEMLSASRKSVLDVALDTGFANHETFTRAFGQVFGITPSGYRKRALELAKGAAGAPPLPSPRQPQPAGGDDVEPNITQLPGMTVAKVRHTGPYDNCQIAWDTLCAWGASQGLFGPQTVFLGISWDDPEATPPEQIRYDACFTLPQGVAPESANGVEIATLPGGRYATALHKGPFSGLEGAYKELYAAIISREGLRLRDAPDLEFYRTDPKTTPPEECVTEICIPLED